MKVYVACNHGTDERYGDWTELRLLNYPYETIVEMAQRKGFNPIYFEAELT